MSSLSARLLVSVSVLLLFFFGATIVVLDVAFRTAAEQAQADILDGHLMALLAAAEPTAAGILGMPPDMPEPRFGNLGSGLYGEIRDADGLPLWRSRSAPVLALGRSSGQSRAGVRSSRSRAVREAATRSWPRTSASPS